MQAKIRIVTSETATVDIGNIPLRMLEQMIQQAPAGLVFGDWGLYDLTTNVTTALEEVSVEEA